jgi:branched-chain amino acid transport system substrate-binding protein
MRPKLAPVLLSVALAALAVACESAKDPVRIGVLADCEGIFGGFYNVALGGAELPLLRRGGRLAGALPDDGVAGVSVGGSPLELVFGCAGEQTSGALELRRLVESEGADIVVGSNVVPLGLVMTEYARHQPDVTFAVTSWEVLTHLNPGPNVFRFTLGYAQGSAGLGAYAYHQLGWRRAATIATPDPLGWGFHAAPVAEFCALGGKIVDRVWLNPDPAQVPAQLSRIRTKGIDGFFVLIGGVEAGIFLERYAKTRPALSRSVVLNAYALTGLDPAVTARLGSGIVGTVAGWDIPGPDIPSFAAYMKEYRRAFPRLADAADASSHLFDVYYQNAMEAVLQALEAVDGDLSDGQRRFRAALADVKLDAPNGSIRLDANRQAIGSVYRFQVTGNDKGTLSIRLVRPIENVDASFGGRFGPGDPIPDRTQPPCEVGRPPAWAVRRG